MQNIKIKELAQSTFDNYISLMETYLEATGKKEIEATTFITYISGVSQGALSQGAKENDMLKHDKIVTKLFDNFLKQN